MLTREVLAAWKEMHIEMRATLSLMQPPIKIRYWLLVISLKILTFGVKAKITTKMLNITTP